MASKLSEIDDLLKMVEGDDKKDEPKKDAKKDEPKSDKKDDGKKDKKGDKKDGDGKEGIMGAGAGTAEPPKGPPKAEVAPAPAAVATGDDETKGKKEKKDDKKDAKNECDEIDQPRTVPTPADPAASAETEGGDDDADDDEDKEMSEALCIPTEAYKMAVEEYRSISEFLDLYRNGDDRAFASEVTEGDSPAMIEKKERPPKGWFQGAVKQIEKDPKVDDPAAVAAHIWHNWAGPKAKKKMKAVPDGDDKK